MRRNILNSILLKFTHSISLHFKTYSHNSKDLKLLSLNLISEWKSRGYFIMEVLEWTRCVSAYLLPLGDTINIYYLGWYYQATFLHIRGSQLLFQYYLFGWLHETVIYPVDSNDEKLKVNQSLFSFNVTPPQERRHALKEFLFRTNTSLYMTRLRNIAVGLTPVSQSQSLQTRLKRKLLKTKRLKRMRMLLSTR